MTAMRGLTHFIFIFALVVSILGSIAVHASAIPHCHSEQHEMSADSEGTPVHHERSSVHCCGSVVYIKGDSTFVPFAHFKPLVFLDFPQTLKPSPLIEGPFQPPRA